VADLPKPSRGANIPAKPLRPAAGAGPTVRRPGWAAQAPQSITRSARPGRAAGSVAARAVAKAQGKVEVDDHYLLALAKQGSSDAYDRLVRRYHSFVRLKASSYFLVGGDSEDLIQEGLVGLYKAIRDYRSDRESSFRNFAELCITRQIITAVKTATRNKHTPLNGYVSFSSSPAGSQGDGDPTLDEVMPGSPVWDPVNQVISSEELSSLVACLSTVLSELESRVLSLYLDGHSYVSIGERLGCDCKTVDNALQRVKRKVGAHLSAREVLL
jgi:RNA polymerase sporulation-specific sigma factor